MIRNSVVLGIVLVAVWLAQGHEPPAAAQYGPYPFSIGGPTSANAGSTIAYRLHSGPTLGGQRLGFIWEGDGEFAGWSTLSGQAEVQPNHGQGWVIFGTASGEVEILFYIPSEAVGDFVVHAYEPGTMTSGTGYLHTTIVPPDVPVSTATVVLTSVPAFSRTPPSGLATPRPPGTGNGDPRRATTAPALLVAGALAALGLAALARRRVRAA